MLIRKLQVYICFFCEERFGDKDRLTSHQNTCKMRSLGLQTLFRDPGLPRQEELRVPDHSRSTKRSFLEHFNIISVGRAEALSTRSGGDKVVCDVILIDDSDEDDAVMDSQPCLGSPSAFITSDGRNLKHRSSISQSIERKNAVVVKRDSDTGGTSHSAQKLLRIDLCSPLGQRLRDHVGTLNSCKCVPYESEGQQLSCDSVVRNNARVYSSSYLRDSSFNDRLRQPSDYRITFRIGRQQCLSSYCHKYKFTSRQRKEFCRAFDCGLSVRARRLRRRMKPCRVELRKLLPILPKAPLSEMREPEPTSYQNSLVSTCSLAVSLTKCDFQLTGGNISVGNYSDLNKLNTINCQMVSSLSSCESSAQETTAALASDSNPCRSDIAATASLVTSGETVAELSQHLTRVSSTSAAVDNLAAEKSDLLSASSARVCNDSNENTNDLSDCSVSVVTERQHRPDSLAMTATSSNVGVDPTASVNCAPTVVQTTAGDSPTSDSGTSFGSSMEGIANTMNRSGWSMSGDLPPLSFFCNICGDVVDCELDAKSLIFDHYAGHGITNIELIDETTPTGEKVIKLIELPTVQANTSHSQAAKVTTAGDRMKSSNPTMVQPQCSSQVEGGITSTAHTQKKQRRVTWADEVYSAVTPQPLQIQSPVCPDAARHDGTSYSLPVNGRPETVPTAIRYPNATAERARMFWSKSSLGEATNSGGPSLHAPVSTALCLQSKPVAHDVLLSTSALSGAWRDSMDVVICID